MNAFGYRVSPLEVEKGSHRPPPDVADVVVVQRRVAAADNLWAGHKRFRVKARLGITSIVATAVFSMRLRTHPSEVSGEHNGGHKHAEADRNPFQNHIGAFG